MSIFEDKVYKGMDWLERVCEPMVCELNDVINELPDRIELDYNKIATHCISSHGISQVSIGLFIGRQEKIDNLCYSDKQRILRCFDVVVDGTPILDMEAETITGGSVTIVKIKESFEDKEVQAMIGVQGIEDHLVFLQYKHTTTERVNEMLELLGMSEARRNRSLRKKMEALVCKMKEIMKNNEWDIRDVALSNRVSLWIRQYLVNGNLAGYKNFCKLKVMTHTDAPIYSVEGEEEL